MRFSKLLPFALLLISLVSGLAAESYLVIDNQTGRILASQDRDQKLQVASLTKIATAAVVLDWAQLNKKDLAQLAPISARALRAGGANPMGLMEGDTVSLRDLLYGALIASDNVAAMALAEYVGARLPNAESLSPIGNFVAHMNALARTLGMKNTRFLNPSGLDSGDEALPFSTASDLARLTRYVYSEADFPFYVAQRSRVVHVFRGGVDNPVELRNTNELLGRNGIDGVKTGQTSKAGGCLIISAEKEPEVKREGDTVHVTPRRIFVIVLGSRDRFGEAAALLQQGWQQYQQWANEGRPLKANQVIQ